jgi:CRP/FNR family cyclic AMP-dependent transcriptional regulator
MVFKSRKHCDWQLFLARATGGICSEHARKEVFFSQGDVANSVFYISGGRVSLSVISKEGRQAVIALLGTGDFFGEECMAGQSFRTVTATAITDCSVAELDREKMTNLIQRPAFAQFFVPYVLSKMIRIQEDLVDQLFNSSEKRLARVLLLLARYGEQGQLEAVIPKVTQETLAAMVGTTRPRVSFFMNKFRRLGFIDYKNGLQVRSSLQNVILSD